MRTPFILKLRNSRCFTFAPLHVQQQIAYNYHKIKINNNIIRANVVISRVTVYTIYVILSECKNKNTLHIKM